MSDWVVGTLSDAINSLDAGVSVNAEDRPHGSGEIGVLKTSALSGGKFHPEQNKAVLPTERNLVAEPVLADSILVSRMNTPALVGESCYLDAAHPTLFLPDRLWQLKPTNRDAVNMRWLSFVLQSSGYRNHIEIHATGTSGSMKNLPKARLLDLPVSYPPAHEQRFIAKVLDALDTTIRQTEAIIEKLKQVKQGLLHDLLTRGIDANGELRPSRNEAPELYKESALGWIPREWNVFSLNEITEAPICYGIVQVFDYIPSGVPVLAIRDLLGDYITNIHRTADSIDAAYPRSRVIPGDVLISIKGTIGRVGVVPAHFSGNISRDIALIRPTSAIRSIYLAQFLRSAQGGFLISHAQVGTTRAEISIAPLRKLKIPIPTIAEQVRIELNLASVDNRIESEISSLKKIKAQKAGLMDDLLTGRVRVTPLLESAAA